MVKGLLLLVLCKARISETGLNTSSIRRRFSFWEWTLSTSWMQECPGSQNFCSVMIMSGCFFIKSSRAVLIIEFVFCGMQESEHRMILWISLCSWTIQVKAAISALDKWLAPLPAILHSIYSNRPSSLILLPHVLWGYTCWVFRCRITTICRLLGVKAHFPGRSKSLPPRCSLSVDRCLAAAWCSY